MRMKFTFKSLLVAAGLLVGSTNAWAGIHYILNQDFNSQPNVWSNTVDGISYQSENEGDYYVYQVGRSSGHNANWYTPACDWSDDIEEYTVEFDYKTNVNASQLAAFIALMDANTATKGGSGTRWDYGFQNTSAANGVNNIFWAQSTGVANNVTTYTIQYGEASLTNAGTFEMANGTWYHFSIAINKTTKAVSYTITSAGKDEQKGSYTTQSSTGICTGVVINAPRSGNMSFDNFVIFNEVDGEVVLSPTIDITAVNGVERTVTITSGTSSEGKKVTTYYTTDGSEPTAKDNEYSEPLTIKESCTVKAISISETGIESEITELYVETKSITLNAPIVTLSSMAATNGVYYPVVDIAHTASVEGFTPVVTLKYDLDGVDVTASVKGGQYTFTSTGTLTVTASSEGYTENSSSYTVEYMYGKTDIIDIASITEEKINTTYWTKNAAGDTETRWGWSADAPGTYYTLSSEDYVNVGLEGITLWWDANEILIPRLYIGKGLMWNLGGSTSKNISYTNGTSDQIIIWTYLNNYGKAVLTAVTAGNQPYALYRFSDMLSKVEVYTPIKEVSVEISEAGYTTFSSEYALNLDELPEGLTAYYVKESGINESTVTISPATGNVKAGEGLIFKGDAKTYSVSVAETGAELEGNLLVAVKEETNAPKGSYVFAYDKKKPTETAAFYQVASDDASVPAGKAYLSKSASEAKVLRIVFGDETATAIEAVAAETEADGTLYNVAGQQVGSDYKGIVIKNGKKYLNK